MARVVLAADISGTRDGKEWPPLGSEVDLPDDEAQSMVRSGNAVWPDDERADRLRSGYHGTDSDLAGAPSGRDITEGQPDTNLARARYLANKGKEEARAEARKAAERVDYTDEQTVPQRAAGPKVGDDEPNPTDAPAVESADAAKAGEERAVVRSEPRKR